jgi:hypothetical protein
VLRFEYVVEVGDTATMLELFPSRTAFLLHDLPALKLRNLGKVFFIGTFNSEKCRGDLKLVVGLLGDLLVARHPPLMLHRRPLARAVSSAARSCARAAKVLASLAMDLPLASAIIFISKMLKGTPGRAWWWVSKSNTRRA